MKSQGIAVLRKSREKITPSLTTFRFNFNGLIIEFSVSCSTQFSGIGTINLLQNKLIIESEVNVLASAERYRED